VNKDIKIGVGTSLGAYIFWGFMPLYWDLLSSMAPLDILGYRIVWALAFMAVIIAVKGNWRRTFFSETKNLLHERKQLLYVVVASILVTLNWLLFIWMVNSGHTLESSLGYFINPLLNFVLAVIFLKERPGRSGIAACLIALLGVIIMTIQTGVFPWQAIVLASSFAFYGLAKKKIVLAAYTSLTLETLIMTPIALVYLIVFTKDGFMMNGLSIDLLTIGCGIATAIPLFLFAESTKRISYIALGFIQYISPTITFFVAIFMLHELFSWVRLIGFIVIWISIAVFSIGIIKESNQREVYNV
jgi:chloramphenicol-sensitive protein RarD